MTDVQIMNLIMLIMLILLVLLFVKLGISFRKLEKEYKQKAHYSKAEIIYFEEIDDDKNTIPVLKVEIGDKVFTTKPFKVVNTKDFPIGKILEISYLFDGENISKTRIVDDKNKSAPNNIVANMFFLFASFSSLLSLIFLFILLS